MTPKGEPFVYLLDIKWNPSSTEILYRSNDHDRHHAKSGGSTTITLTPWHVYDHDDDTIADCGLHRHGYYSHLLLHCDA